MMLKYAIALAILLVLALAFTWAFLPARYLPGNRARHLRIRLHLRLHPGKGFAHLFGLWLRWGRLAVLRRSGRIRPACRCGTGSPNPASTPSSSAGPTTGTPCASRSKSTCWSCPRPGCSRPRSWPTSSCATPARSSPPAPNPTSTP